jgi:hypothetical protein
LRREILLMTRECYRLIIDIRWGFFGLELMSRFSFAFSVDVVEVEEPCAHEVQFGGMCAECGKDMTE